MSLLERQSACAGRHMSSWLRLLSITKHHPSALLTCTPIIILVYKHFKVIFYELFPCVMILPAMLLA